MIFASRDKILREQMVRMVEDDEEIEIYEAPVEMKVQVHHSRDRRSFYKESGRYESSELEIYLRPYQEITEGDLITYNGNVYKALADPIDYLKHRVVALKWVKQVSI